MSTEQLRENLLHSFSTLKLPGKQYQDLMAPSSRNPENIRHDSSPIPSAVMILLYPKNNQICIPLIKRPDYNGAHSGQISLPGGKYESNDHTLKNCAIRETQEEIGIECSPSQIVGSLTPLFVPISNYNITPFIAILQEEPQFTICHNEVKYIIELPLNHILEKKYQSRKNIQIDKKLIAPTYNINDEQIWGATAMILSEFSEIIKRLK